MKKVKVVFHCSLQQQYNQKRIKQCLQEKIVDEICWGMDFVEFVSDGQNQAAFETACMDADLVISSTSSSYKGGLHVLVVDDDSDNLLMARTQYEEQGPVFICRSYLLAMAILSSDLSFDVVMTDLLMPMDSTAQRVDLKFVDQEGPMGIFVATLALEKGIDLICVVSNTNHHDHPAAHAAEMLGSDGSTRSIRWFCDDRCVMTRLGGKKVKDWRKMLTS